MIKIINIYSNKNINIISLIISIIIFSIVYILINNFSENKNYNSEKNELNIQNIISQNNEEKNQENNKEEKKVEENKFNWYIEIPKINLIAPIEESTEMDILNNYVGHFEDTSTTYGNIGLAGHNRGYEKNYFANLKNLKIGDEIKYKYNDFEKTYIIKIIKKIENTNWDYLEETKDNKITLITCVENEPDYRLCVQGAEI